MIKFNVTKIRSESIIPNIPSEIHFPNEALEEGIEFIGQNTVLDILRPYLKDPVGAQVVYSSPNTSGTPISKIEIITHDGALLIRLERR